MFRWIPYTFVRTVLFFIAGILFALSYPDLVTEWLLWGLILFLTFLYLIVALARRNLRRLINPGWVALPLVFVMGNVNVVNHTEPRDANHLLNHTGTVESYTAIVTRFPEERQRTWKVEASITNIKSDGWQKKCGKLILYFTKSDFKEPFRYGDVLVIKGTPRLVDAPANPGEFDYREYLRLKNIYHQHFIRKGEVIKYAHEPPSFVMAFAYDSREWAQSALNMFISGDREQGIASALVLGVTDGLDDELLSAYSATGSMHILAVSGLHISILYFLLLRILSPLNRVPRGRWFIAFISLTTLWLYAIITGLSPSVLRAVGMFSFMAIARPWAKSTNVYNTLAVSAFCLLVYDPFLIRSVGFQLSYLAVLGIVYLYPRIVRLWEPEHSVTVEIWKLASVSIAAQIATFPLGLLYFHQFPNYFLLSNLLVVPLSFVVLILGIVVIAVGVVPWLAIPIGFCLQYTIVFLNWIVFTLEELPFSLITDVYITPLQCGLLLIFIVAITCLFEFRKFAYLLVAFSVLIAFSSLQWVHFIQDVNVRKVVVYKVPGHTAVDLIDAGNTVFLSNGELPGPEKFAFHIAPYRQIAGIRHESRNLRDFAFPGARLIWWQGKSILQITKPGFQLPSTLTADLIIVGNNAVEDVRMLGHSMSRAMIILDSSNSFFFASRFLEAAKLYKLEVHSVLHQGAFVSKFEKKDT